MFTLHPVSLVPSTGTSRSEYHTLDPTFGRRTETVRRPVGRTGPPMYWCTSTSEGSCHQTLLLFTTPEEVVDTKLDQVESIRGRHRDRWISPEYCLCLSESEEYEE